ncbi:MAG: carbohydrate kinase family protein [Nanoarchaeota archaeon]|nr:carbohydrate kinase family protein [Nanoarchaeota archaeon]
MNKYDAVTVGSGLVDAYVRAEFKEKDGMMYFPSGTKILVDKIAFSVGGGGINSAMCFSHLGLKTGFMGKIGSKANGSIITRELIKNKIDFLGVISKKEHTGYSIILESEKKNRTIVSSKAASDNLKFSEINLGKFETKWFYFTSLGGESFLTQKKIAIYARKNKIMLAYNPSSYHTKKGIDYLRPILENCNVLSLNKEEAKMLIRNGNLYKGLRNLGPNIVSITDGAGEGGIYDGKYLYSYIPPKINVKEATGAGDVFASSFVSGLLKLGNIEGALKAAITHSAFAISREDGIGKRLSSWKNIEKIMQKNKLKIKKIEL